MQQQQTQLSIFFVSSCYQQWCGMMNLYMHQHLFAFTFQQIWYKYTNAHSVFSHLSYHNLILIFGYLNVTFTFSIFLLPFVHCIFNICYLNEQNTHVCAFTNHDNIRMESIENNISNMRKYLSNYMSCVEHIILNLSSIYCYILQEQYISKWSCFDKMYNVTVSSFQ